MKLNLAIEENDDRNWTKLEGKGIETWLSAFFLPKSWQHCVIPFMVSFLGHSLLVGGLSWTESCKAFAASSYLDFFRSILTTSFPPWSLSPPVSFTFYKLRGLGLGKSGLSHWSRQYRAHKTFLLACLPYILRVFLMHNLFWVSIFPRKYLELRFLKI